MGTQEGHTRAEEEALEARMESLEIKGGAPFTRVPVEIARECVDWIEEHLIQRRNDADKPGYKQ